MKKKTLASFVGVTALFGSAIAASSPASAAPNWDFWNVTSGSALTAGTTVKGSGKLVLDSVINGFATRIECRVPELFSKVLTSADVESMAPGSSRSISFNPTAAISTSGGGAPLEGICQDVSSGPYGSPATVPLDVNTQNGAWTLNLKAPTPGVSGVFGGSITGDLVLPENAILFEDPSIGCLAEGPTGVNPGDPTNLVGSYNTGTNKLMANPGQLFGATSPDLSCTVEDTELVSTDVGFSPWISLKF